MGLCYRDRHAKLLAGSHSRDDSLNEAGATQGIDCVYGLAARPALDDLRSDNPIDISIAVRSPKQRSIDSNSCNLVSIGRFHIVELKGQLMSNCIWTVGYGGRKPSEFLDLLVSAKIELVADVRLTPRGSMGSYTRANSSDKGIQRLLSSAGIGYEWFPELGNPDRHDPEMARFRSEIGGSRTGESR